MTIEIRRCHKYKNVSRKLKVVQGDLDRVIERAEEFEAKSRLIETEGLVSNSYRTTRGSLRSVKMSSEDAITRNSMHA